MAMFFFFLFSHYSIIGYKLGYSLQTKYEKRKFSPEDYFSYYASKGYTHLIISQKFSGNEIYGAVSNFRLNNPDYNYPLILKIIE
ncbi:MAG: hypothetical protein AB8E15_08525, partial [Bdellovibrionales bacterium]